MTFLLLYVPTAAAFAAALALLHRKSRDAREGLARELHDRALAADQRADALQQQLDRLALRQRIDHLHLLVDHGERGGQLSAAVAQRLRGHVLRLHEETEL